MAEVLLKELSNTDIDWIATTGHQESIAAGTILIQPCQDPEWVYLLLDGTLSLSTPIAPAGKIARAAGDRAERDIIQLMRGEIVGETSLFSLCSMPAIVKAVDPAVVLAVPKLQLMAKLEQDLTFSTHFYRAIALILSNRLRRLLKTLGQIQPVGEQPMKDALFVFGELRDNDIDWLVTAGQVEKFVPGQALIQAGRPIDALYLILDGLISVAVPEGERDPLAMCFQGLDSNSAAQRVFAYLSKGEMVGTVSFLNFDSGIATFRAVKETLVLSIARQQLAIKLQQDMGFASRFYRILIIQISSNLQMIMSNLGGSQLSYQQHQDLDEDVEYDDELCLTSLGQISQGAAKFNWALKRLGIGY